MTDRDELTLRERNWLGDQGQARIEWKYDALIAERDTAIQQKNAAMILANNGFAEKDAQLTKLVETLRLAKQYAIHPDLEQAIDAALASTGRSDSNWDTRP